jgi:hypothetical protein
VRYYGWYPNRGRGEWDKRKQAAVSLPEVPTRLEILDVSDYLPKKIPSPKWRECIKKVWEVDPLSCPKCGSEMKIISFINETDVIRKILKHLGLWEEKTLLERAPPDHNHGYICKLTYMYTYIHVFKIECCHLETPLTQMSFDKGIDLLGLNIYS